MKLKYNFGRQRTLIVTGMLLFFLPAFIAFTQQTGFKLNDQGVFKNRGVDLMIYNDSFNEGGFFDEKVNGIEMIHHGVRTVTGGAVRLNPTPEQWDLTPVVTDRKVNLENNSVEVTLNYKEYNFTSRIKVEPKGNSCILTVILDAPLPKSLEGKAGMNIEFLPATYFKKTYYMDGKAGICPLYPGGPMVLEPFENKTPQWGGQVTAEIFDNQYAKPLPMATGKKLVLAPEAPEVQTAITSLTGEISFLDGRNLAQNGWYVIRELIPAGKAGEVVKWELTPNSIPDWVRQPVISYSQVGYTPNQEKVAVIELDINDSPGKSASLYRVNENGVMNKIFTADVKNWGQFRRYTYQQFDFSSVKEPGIYIIEYGSLKTGPFPIGSDVYEGIWHPTLDVWFPVQMDHMFVNEAYRVWHGAAHLDDARQAPLDTAIHDGYTQNSRTDSPFQPLERIPGLNIGGWFDAGDFDIRTNSHCETVLYMIEAWENYKLIRDQTMVKQDIRHVEIHRPDGTPDLQQQIEHGVLALIAQYRSVGHAIRGIIVPHLHQYHHLGDAVNMTDNLPYNPSLKPGETNGLSSGNDDDRWAFTNVLPPVSYQSATTLAAASRALRGYNDKLADECLTTAKKVWDEQVAGVDDQWLEDGWFGTPAEFLKQWLGEEELRTTVELLVTTGDKKYSDHFIKNNWPRVKDRVYQTRFYAANLFPTVLKTIPYMDESFKKELRTVVIAYKQQLDSLMVKNPYGVPVGTGGFWEGNYSIIDWALCAGSVHQAFPDIVGPEYTIRGLNYILGCHPASNISFVSAVGTNSKTVTYGNNRADFTFIAGGVVPGIYLIKPDFYENKEDWPFIWYENECVIDMCAGYIYLAAMANDFVK